MIELRWVQLKEDQHPNTLTLAIRVDSSPMYIMQYRETIPLPSGSSTIVWSKWQNVPVVSLTEEDT